MENIQVVFGVLADFGKRENFRSAWAISGLTFDDRFQNYMEKTLKQEARVVAERLA